jgi:N-acylneuraminate cytidylyltransferase
MNIVAIIPARGGSKRIPRKNVKLFGGLPMIAYSIQAAQKAAVFDRIIVSTDDDEIMTVARQYGAEAPFRRPSELSNDFATTDAVVNHALQWLAENNCAVHYCCCICATAPFLQVEYLCQGLELLKSSCATGVFPVTKFPYTIFRALKLNDQGRVEMLWPENYRKRSQDFPEVFHDAGQFYWTDVEKRRANQAEGFADCVPIFLPRYLVQDIDTPEDWEVAERMFLASQTSPKPEAK